MGEDFVANAFANATEFTMPMQEYITRNAWAMCGNALGWT